MPLKPRVTFSDGVDYLQNRAAPTLVFFYQLIVLVCFALIPLFAVRWMRQPFIGAFLDYYLFVNRASPTRSGSWDLRGKVLPDGSHVVAFDGQPTGNARQFNNLLEARQPGDHVTITLENLQGERVDQAISLQEFPAADRLAYLIIPYLIGLIYLGSSIWIFSLRRGDASGRAFALFTAAVGLCVAGLFDTYTTNGLTPLWTASLALAGGALFNLTLLFPEEAPLVSRLPFIRWAAYIPSILLAGYGLTIFYSPQYFIAYARALWFEIGFVSLAVVFFLVRTFTRYFSSTSPIAREQARLVLWGAAISFIPLAAVFALLVARPEWHYSSAYLLPLVFFPGVTGYTILRYRLPNTDYLLSRVTLYALLSILAAIGYALLVSGLSLIFGSAMPATHPLLIGLMVFIFAILLQPFRQRLQRYIDELFFRGQALYQQRSQTFGRELTQTFELPAILTTLRSYIQRELYPDQIHIFIRNLLSGQYVAEPDDKDQPTTDIRFPPNSSLVQTLTQRRSALFLGGSDTLPTLLQTERARLALLGVQLFIPMPSQLRLVGWIGLGSKLSGEPYTNNDLRYLEALGDQAALAVERAQVIGNLERRVHEMDVLTRVAQGINITLAFDDILELIYAQTNQLIPTRDMRVALINDLTQTLFYAFYLENDERLPDRENVPLPANQILEDAIIRSRRAILTDDYEAECRSRGILAHDPEIFAWIGVPLNAGADTIGAISLGSRDPSLVFTESHLNLLQAIADLAAGAIVKARLLQESERHARQLATLNEVGKSLTSTLELKPLLKQILESAAEILNCEAGSLFMLDEHSNELIFEVTVGPVAAELVGQRLSPGTGLVGKAVLNGQPIISNDVRKTQDWSDKTDQQTGFITRDLLVVPMLVHNQAIGVIEVINKQDRSPFNSDDQELLATFASQAAVAVENARLYTQTDEALTARVEELSVMQRIDRELNTSLDLERSMHITLEWAMRQSRSEAGLAALLDGSDGARRDIHVIAHQGYEGESDSTDQSFQPGAGSPILPVDVASLQKVIETGQPQLFFQPATTENGAPADRGVDHPLTEQRLRSQVVIPIRRTSEVIGVIVLETRQVEGYPQETIAFLSRLSDHAAIAISNAQLYADLQTANIAKSDFVSLVSHELKTPMTSIRGYADLLAQGVVGPVNEVQANFLNTIRSNVGRMSTLVSDLADVSRIEAGRMRLEFSAVKLPDVIQEVVRSQQAQIDEKKQTLTVNHPINLPDVWGDQNRINQIITNLLSNAQKYTPAEGEITITAVRTENVWDAKGSPEVVRLDVHDSGFGISPKDQVKIFQKFFRSEEQNIRESPGTGLGLNITRHLVEMQGGRIWFESEPGKGTTFSITIPIAASS